MDHENRMNLSSRNLRGVARFLCVWMVISQTLFTANVYAGGILFPKTPMASSVESVKPNVLFMLDDSASMGLDYLPDHVRNETLFEKSQFGNCFDSGDTNHDISGNPIDCGVGDVPHMASAFNSIYYDPSISYKPPAKGDGTFYPSQTTPTAVATDPFGQQQKDQLGRTASTVDLTTGYPEHVWCASPTTDPATDTPADNSGACKRNLTGYVYPDDVFKYGKRKLGGTNIPTTNYVYGAPYYYNLLPDVYCDNPERKNWGPDSVDPVGPWHCQSTSTPVGTYTFPAPVQWCEYPFDSGPIDYTNVAKFYTPANKCQGKRVGNYAYPRFLGMVTAPVVQGTSYATFDIANGLVAHQVISAITVGSSGPNILNGSPTIETTDSDTSATVAASLANSINLKTASVNVDADVKATDLNPWEFIACAGSGITGVGCRQAPFDAFLIDPAGVPDNRIYVFPARPTGAAVSPLPYSDYSPKPVTYSGAGPFPHFSDLSIVGTLPSVEFVIPSGSTFNGPFAVYDVKVDGVQLISSASPVWAVNGLPDSAAANAFADPSGALCTALANAAPSDFTVSCSGGKVTVTGKSSGSHTANFSQDVANTHFRLASIERTAFATKVSVPAVSDYGPYVINSIPVLVNGVPANALGTEVVDFDKGQDPAVVAALIATKITAGSGFRTKVSGGEVYIYDVAANNPPRAITAASSGTYVAKSCSLTVPAMDPRGPGVITSLQLNGVEVLSGPVSLSLNETASAIATDLVGHISAGFTSDKTTPAAPAPSVVTITKDTGVSSCNAPVVSMYQYGQLTASDVTNTVPAYVTGVFVNGGSNALAATLTEAAGTAANSVAASIKGGISSNNAVSHLDAAIDGSNDKVVYVSQPGVNVNSLAFTVNSTYGKVTFGNVSDQGPATITDVIVEGTHILPAPLVFPRNATGNTIASGVAAGINATNPGGYYAIASGSDLYIYNPNVNITSDPTVAYISGYGVITTDDVTPAPVYIRGVTPVPPIAPINLLTATITELNGAGKNTVASDIVNGVNTGGSGYQAHATGNNVYVYKPDTNVDSVSANLVATYGALQFAAVDANAPAQVAAVTVNGANILGGVVNLAANSTAATVAAAVAAQVNVGHVNGFYSFSNNDTVYLFNNVPTPITTDPVATIVSSYGIITVDAAGVGSAPAYITNITINGGTVLYSGALPLTAGWSNTQVASQIAGAINNVLGYTATASGGKVYIYKQGTAVNSVAVTNSATYGLLTTNAVTDTVPAYVTGVWVNGSNILSSSLTENQNISSSQVATDIGAGIGAQSTYNHLEATNKVYVTKPGISISTMSATVASSWGLIQPSAVNSFGPARISSIVVNGHNLLNGTNVDLAAGAAATSVANSIATAINAQSGTTSYYARLKPGTLDAVYVYNNIPENISAAPTVTIVADYGKISANAVGITPAYINSITVSATPAYAGNLVAPLTLAAGSTADTVATAIKNAINAGGSGYSAVKIGTDVYLSNVGSSLASVAVASSSSYGVLDATGVSVSSTVPAYVNGITVNGGGNLIPTATAAGGLVLAAGANAASIATSINNAINADTGSNGGYASVLSGSQVYVYKNGTAISAIAATAISSFAKITPSAVSAFGPARITAVTVNGSNRISGSLDFGAGATAATVANSIRNAVNAATGTNGGYLANLVGTDVYIYKPATTISSGPTVSIVSQYGTLTTTAVSSTVPAYVTGVFVTTSPVTPANLLSGSRTELAGSSANTVAADINTGINLGGSGFSSTTAGANVVYISKLGTDVTAASAPVNATYGQIDVTTGVAAAAGARITALTANATNLFGPGGYVDLPAGSSANAVATAIFNQVNASTGTNGGYYAVQSGNTVYVYNPTVAISTAPAFTSVATYGVITPNAVNSFGWAQISTVTVGGTNIIDPAAPLNLAPSTSAATIATSIFNAVNSYTGTSGYTAILSGSTVYVSKPGTAAAVPVVTIVDTYATLTTSAISNTAPGYINAVNVTSAPAYAGNLINPAALPLTIAAGTTANGVATAIGNAINAYTGTSGFSAVVVGNIVYISRAGYATTAAAVTSNSSYASLTPSNVGATPASVTGVFVNGGATNIMGTTVGPFVAGETAVNVATAITNAINLHTGTNGGYTANQVGATVYVSHPTAPVSTLLATTDATYAQLDASNVTNAPARINQINVMGTNVLGSQIVEVVNKTGTQVAADIAAGINAYTGTSGYSANSSGNSVFIYKGGVAITAAPTTSVNASYGTITANAVSANGRAEISQINVNGINLLAGNPVDLPAGTAATTVATAIATAINAGASGYTAVPNGVGGVNVYKQWVTVNFDATPVVATTSYGTLLVTSGNTATTPAYITGVFANGGANLLTSGSITVAAGASATTIAGQIVSAINGGSSGYWATSSGATVYISKYGVDVTTVTATYNNTYGSLAVSAVNANVPAQISNISVMGTDVLGGTPLNLPAGTTQSGVATAIANAINATHPGGYYAVAGATSVQIYNPSVAITVNPTATVISGFGVLTANPVLSGIPAYLTGVFVNGGGANLLASSRTLTGGWTATQVATDIAAGINANTGASGYSATSVGAAVYVYQLGVNVTSVSASINATYGILLGSSVNANGPARIMDVTVNGTNILPTPQDFAASTLGSAVATTLQNQINLSHIGGYYAVASGADLIIYNPTVSIVTNPSATVISDYGVLTANAVGANAPAYLTSVYVNGNGALNLISATRTLTRGWTATQVATNIAAGINAGGSGYSATSSGANVYVYKAGTAVTSVAANVNATYGQLDMSAIGAGPVRVASVLVNATDLFAGHPLDIAANTTAANAATAVANQINTYSGYTASVTGASVFITHPTLAITTNPSATINANYGILTTTAIGASPVPVYITAVNVTSTPAYAANLLASPLVEAANTTANQVAIDIANAINLGGSGFTASYSANQVYIYKAGSDVTGASATVLATYGQLTVPSAVNANAPAQITAVTVNATNLLASPLNLAAGTTTITVANSLAAQINANSGVSGYSAAAASGVVYIYSPTQTISSNPSATIVSDYGLLTANAIGPVPGYITGVFVNGGGSIIVGSRTEAANATAAAVAGDIGVAINANTGTSTWASSTSGNTVYVYKQGTNVTSVSATINNATYGQLTFGAVSTNGHARVTGITVNGTQVITGYVALSAGTTASDVATAVATNINTNHLGGYYAIASGAVVYIYNVSVAIAAAPVVTISADYGTLTFASDVASTVPAYVTGVFPVPAPATPNILASSLIEPAGTVKNTVASDVATGINGNSGTSGYSASTSGNVVYLWKPGQSISSVSTTINSTYGQLTFAAVNANAPALVTAITVNSTNILASAVTLAAGTTAANAAIAVASQINATHTGGYYAVANAGVLYIYHPSVAISTNPSATIVSGYGTFATSAVTGPVPASILGVYANGGGTNLISGTLTEATGRTAAQVASDIAAAITANTGANGGYLASSSGNTVYIYASGIDVTSVSATVSNGYGQLVTSAVGSGTAYVTSIMVNGGSNILSSPVTLAANATNSQVATAIAAGVTDNSGASGYSAVTSTNNVYLYNPAVASITSIVPTTSTSLFGKITASAVSALAPAYITAVTVNGVNLLGSMQTVAAGSSAQTVATAIQTIVAGAGYTAALDAALTSVIITKPGVGITSASYTYKQPYALMNFSATGADPAFVKAVTVNGVNALTAGVVLPPSTSAAAAAALVQANIGNGFGATVSGNDLAIYSTTGTDITSATKDANVAFKSTIDVGTWIGGDGWISNLVVGGVARGTTSAADPASLALAGAGLIGTASAYPYYASASGGVITIYGANDPAPTYVKSYPTAAWASATITIGPLEADFDLASVTNITIISGGSCTAPAGPVTLMSGPTSYLSKRNLLAGEIVGNDKAGDNFSLSASLNVVTVREVSPGTLKGQLNGCSLSVAKTFFGSSSNPPTFTVAPFSGGAGVVTDRVISGPTGGGAIFPINDATVTGSNGTGSNTTTLTLTPSTGLTTMVVPTPGSGTALAAPTAGTGSSLAAPTGGVGVALAAPAATTGTTTTAPTGTIGTALAALTPGTGTNGAAPTGSSAASMAAPTGNHGTTTTAPANSSGVSLTAPTGGNGVTSAAPTPSAGNALAALPGSTGIGMTAPTFGSGNAMTLPATTTTVSLTLTPAFSYSLTFTYGNGASLIAPTSGNGHSTTAAGVSTASSFTNPSTSNSTSMNAPTGGSGASLATPTYNTGSSLSAVPSGSTGTSMTAPATTTGSSTTALAWIWNYNISMSAPVGSTGTSMNDPTLGSAYSLGNPAGTHGTSTSLSYGAGVSYTAPASSRGSSLGLTSISYSAGMYAIIPTLPSGGSVPESTVGGWPTDGSGLYEKVDPLVTGSIIVGAKTSFIDPVPGSLAMRSNQGTFVRVDVKSPCGNGTDSCYGATLAADNPLAASKTYYKNYFAIDPATKRLYKNRRDGDCVKYKDHIYYAADGSTITGKDTGWEEGCTYEEEMTNFSNWYAYYRTRMQTMKSAAGAAFDEMGSSYRVGFITIHPNTSQYTHISDFNAAQKTEWFSQLYSTPIPNEAQTPLRSAVSTAGRIFAGKKPVDNHDPVQFYCQQNFLILTTDGFWFEGDESKVVKLDGDVIGNQDNVFDSVSPNDPYYDGDRPATGTAIGYSCPLGKTGAGGTDDPKCKGSAARDSCSGACNPDSTADPAIVNYYSTNTLADVTRYYYETDLRDSSLNNCDVQVNGVTYQVCRNEVYTSSRDSNTKQHMVTFTVGLGVEGALNYVDSKYETATSGDYYDILHNTKAWPQVRFNDLTAVDDLWHAAVNSHGLYFSAKNPVSLAASLKEALHDINMAALGSAASASNPVPEMGDNFIFAAAYTTLEWTGQVTGNEIDLSSGYVGSPLWCVTDIASHKATIAGNEVTVPACDGKLKYQIPSKNDSFSQRHIYLYSSANSNHLREFDYDNLTADEQNYFKVSQLYQYQTSGVSAAALADQGNGNRYLVRYLRGESDHEARDTNTEDARLFRSRKALLGDVVGAQPVYVKTPRMAFLDPGYAAFVRAQQSPERPPTLYVGANDGMLHAFDASTVGSSGPNTFNSATTGGTERWAYIPSQVLPNLWQLAQDSAAFDGVYYATHHSYNVNGTPTVADVCVNHCDDPSSADWRTILVAGLKEGGRGYYALDVTSPNSPKGLWEFTTATMKGAVRVGANVGYAFGTPIITKYCAGGSSNITKTCVNPKWVVLLASGYNNSTATGGSGGGDGGGYVFMLDPLTGELLRTFSTGRGSDSSPSGLAYISAFVQAPLVNSFARYVYGGDLTGHLYRFDLETDGTTTDGVAAEMRVIAEMKDPSGVQQPITIAPTLTYVPGIAGSTAGSRMIIVGTGKYLETPDQNDTQTQTVMAFYDRDSYASDGGDTIGGTANPLRNTSTHMKERTLGAPAEVTVSGVKEWHRSLTGDDLLATDRGWYIDLGASVTDGSVDNEFANNLGERVVINIPISHGVIYVPTSVPRPSSVCSPGGHSWYYELNVLTGLPVGTSGVVQGYTVGGMITGVTAVDVAGGTSFITSDTAHDHVNPDPRPIGFGSNSIVQGKRSSWRELLD